MERIGKKRIYRDRIKIGKELGRRIVLKVYYSFKRIYIYDIKNIE